MLSDGYAMVQSMHHVLCAHSRGRGRTEDSRTRTACVGHMYVRDANHHHSIALSANTVSAASTVPAPAALNGAALYQPVVGGGWCGVWGLG